MEKLIKAPLTFMSEYKVANDDDILYPTSEDIKEAIRYEVEEMIFEKKLANDMLIQSGRLDKNGKLVLTFKEEIEEPIFVRESKYKKIIER